MLEPFFASVNGVLWTGGLVDGGAPRRARRGDSGDAQYLAATAHILQVITIAAPGLGAGDLLLGLAVPTVQWQLRLTVDGGGGAAGGRWCQYVLSANGNGTYFPLWATCLGFERLIELLAEDEDDALLARVDAADLALSLNLTAAGWRSRMLGGASRGLLRRITAPTGARAAFNNHGLGVSPTAFAASKAARHLVALSIDSDRRGKAFVSTVEGRHLPIYGTQWHPEKPPWEWSLRLHLPHDAQALELSSSLGRFFVDECKYNSHAFPSAADEAAALLYNWAPTFISPQYHIHSNYTQASLQGSNHSISSGSKAGASEVLIADLPPSRIYYFKGDTATSPSSRTISSG
eukprot:SM000024S07761  [mRNA]  locus=s24:297977:299745:+ [translate_table: standard]